jgi:hypothetical protein
MGGQHAVTTILPAFAKGQAAGRVPDQCIEMAAPTRREYFPKCNIDEAVSQVLRIVGATRRPF